MKQHFLIAIFFLFSVSVFAQKGLEVKAQYGIGGIGYDRWITSNTVTLEANYNINSIVAIGPFYTTSFGTKYYIFDKTNTADAKVNIIGVNSNLTFARLGRFRGYGNVNAFTIKASTGRFINSQFSQFSDMEESMFGFGIGAGVMMNLGSRFALNLFDFKLRFLKRDYLSIDQSIYRFYQFGAAYTFSLK
ncbi:MAG: outer membrane beta-barrel protein [Cyclobacteriaceae bacterium]